MPNNYDTPGHVWTTTDFANVPTKEPKPKPERKNKGFRGFQRRMKMRGKEAHPYLKAALEAFQVKGFDPSVTKLVIKPENYQSLVDYDKAVVGYIDDPMWDVEFNTLENEVIVTKVNNATY